MAQFIKRTDRSGKVRYLKDGRFTTEDKLDSKVRETLNSQDEGTKVDDKGQVVEEDKSGEGDQGNRGNGEGQDGGDADPNAQRNNGTQNQNSSQDGNNQSPETPSDNPPDTTGSAKRNTKGTSEKERIQNDPNYVPNVNTPPGMTPQTDPGMGFKRVKGVTVDIFDGKTPHTHVKNVNGRMVPLSRENYETRTDAEIAERLNELDDEE